MGRLSLDRLRVARLLLPLWIAALALPTGCASTRQHLPSFADLKARVARPDLPDWSEWASWERWPLLRRLRPPAPGAIQGRLVEADPAALGHAVVFLDPLDPERATAPPSEAVVVRQRRQRFSPGLLVAAAGQTVVFENHDAIYHRVFSYSDAGAFDLGVLEQGGSRSVTLAQPGLVRFFCALHADESGLILVTPSPHFATVDAEGRYRIPDVPPGQYRLHAWSEARSETTREVTVEPGAAASVDVPVGRP
jgi:plastocyanin